MRCPEQLVLKMPCVNRRDKINVSLSCVGRYVTGVLFNYYMVALRCVCVHVLLLLLCCASLLPSVSPNSAD